MSSSAPRPGSFVVVPYDAACRPLPEIAVDPADDRPATLVDAADRALPADARAFALYDASGALAHLAARPPETLTNDPDVTAMAFDPSGTYIATGHAAGDLRLWDAATGEPVWDRAPADEPITGVLFVARGPWVLAWSDDGPLLVFDRAAGELVVRVEDPQIGPFTATVSPDGTEVALTGARVVRIALPDGDLRPALDADRVPPRDSAAEAEDAAEQEDLRALTGSDELDDAGPLDEGVVWVAYAPGGRIVGVRSAEPDDELAVWSADTGARTATVRMEHGIGACDLSPDGVIVALGMATEPVTVRMYDLARGHLSEPVDVGGQGLHDLRFTPDGTALVVHVAGVGIVTIDVASGSVRTTVPEASATTFVVPRADAVIPEEVESPPIMVTHGSSGQLELTPLQLRPMFGPVGRTLSADGARYVTVPFATDNNYAAVYDLARSTGVGALAHRGNVQEAWLSPDGTRIVVRAAGHVTVWSVPNAPARRGG